MAILQASYSEQFDIRDWSNWGSGPWDGEPDQAEWLDADTLYPCVMYRNGVGAWCGYVGIPPGHILWGKDFDYETTHPEDLVKDHGYTPLEAEDWAQKCEDKREYFNNLLTRLDFHGGITYTDIRTPNRVQREYPGYWWIGFDCAHMADYVPATDGTKDGHKFYKPSRAANYRTAEYVKRELHRINQELLIINKETHPYEPERPEGY